MRETTFVCDLHCGSKRLREQSAQAISKRIQTSCQDPEPGDEDDDKEKKERKEKKKQVLPKWVYYM